MIKQNCHPFFNCGCHINWISHSCTTMPLKYRHIYKDNSTVGGDLALVKRIVQPWPIIQLISTLIHGVWVAYFASQRKLFNHQRAVFNHQQTRHKNSCRSCSYTSSLHHFFSPMIVFCIVAGQIYSSIGTFITLTYWNTIINKLPVSLWLVIFLLLFYSEKTGWIQPALLYGFAVVYIVIHTASTSNGSICRRCRTGM